MAVVGVLDVDAAARRVLGAVTASAAEAGVSLPDRHLVTTGSAVYDCEMVAVTYITVGTGIPGATADAMAGILQQRPPVWQAVLGVAIVRCASERPDGPRNSRPPTAAGIEADSAAASADAAVIANAAYSLTDDWSVPDVAIQFFQPEGGFIATTGTVTVPLWA